MSLACEPEGRQFESVRAHHLNQFSSDFWRGDGHVLQTGTLRDMPRKYACCSLPALDPPLGWSAPVAHVARRDIHVAMAGQGAAPFRITPITPHS